MRESRIDDKKVRNALKSKRNLLFADFSRNPSNIRLALEIRSLDDWIADLDSTLRMKTPGDSLKTSSTFN